MSLPGRLARFDLRKDLWRIVAVLAVLLVANVGFYLMLNLPRLQALGALESGRDDVRISLRAAGKRCEAMRELIKRYDEESGRLDAFFNDTIGTQVERMTTIQKEIRRIATEFRIDPDTIDYTPVEVEGSDLTRFQITIPLVGGYPNLRQFIDRIEGSRHLLIVDSIELSGSREGGAMLSLSIRIATYFKTPEVQGAAVVRPAARR
jgi:Tfp pilus assembly protein PilO